MDAENTRVFQTNASSSSSSTSPTTAVATSIVQKKWNPRSSSKKSSLLTSCDSLYSYQPTRTFFGWFGTTNPFLDALGVSSSWKEKSTTTSSTSTSTSTSVDGKRPIYYINYTKMRPDDITKAASECQARYLYDLKILEESLGEDDITLCSYDDLVPKLERITRPLTILQNHVALFSMVRKEPDFENALHQANDILQMSHAGAFSDRIYNALVRMEHELQNMSNNASEESKRAVRHFSTPTTKTTATPWIQYNKC
jgi:hypothetical protein